MKERTFRSRLKNGLMLLLLLLAGSTAQSQIIIVTGPCGPTVPHVFYDDLLGLETGFAEETGLAGTLTFTSENTPPNYTDGRLMTAAEVLNFINVNQLMSGTSGHTVLYEQERPATIDGMEYTEKYSYGIVQRSFDEITIDDQEYQNAFCMQIGEMLSVSNELYPEPAEIENSYYVIYDDNQNLLGIFGYNEVFTSGTVSYQKYSASPATIQGLKLTSASSAVNKLFTVHPNPATSQVTVSFSLPHDDEAIITIRDISGKKVKDTHLGRIEKDLKQTHTEDVSNLPAGIYTVSLTTSRYMQTIKLTIE